MDSLTLDQIKVFLAIVDEGSFPKAAKQLNRAQSAITYAVRKLEADAGVPLFDRSGYRSVLTPAGRALLIRARRIAEATTAFRDQARSLASGLEPELTIVLDSMFPMTQAVKALRAFTGRFPTVPPRVYVQSLGAAAQLVIDGTCMLGLLPSVVAELTPLKSAPLLTIDLVPVVAPCHPLASIAGPIGADELHRHIQLVLTDSSSITGSKDHGVLSSRTWRLADMGAKRAMLVAGLGWGSMPAHLIADDLATGRLKLIHVDGFDAPTAKLVLCVAHMGDRGLGPAGQWILENLRAMMDEATDEETAPCVA